MAHYYDSVKYHYGFLVNAWVEGFAEAYSEDVLKQLGKIDTNYLHSDYNFADYNSSNRIYCRKNRPFYLAIFSVVFYHCDAGSIRIH